MTASNRLLAALAAFPDDDVQALQQEIAEARANLMRLEAMQTAISLARAHRPAPVPQAPPAPHCNGVAKPLPSPRPASKATRPAAEVETGPEEDKEPRISFDDDDGTAGRPGRTKSPLLLARRVAAVRYIAEHGPQKSGALCKVCDIPDGSSTHVLRCSWFDLEPDGWHITAEARNEVLAKNGE